MRNKNQKQPRLQNRAAKLHAAKVAAFSANQKAVATRKVASLAKDRYKVAKECYKMTRKAAKHAAKEAKRARKELEKCLALAKQKNKTRPS